MGVGVKSHDLFFDVITKRKIKQKQNKIFTDKNNLSAN